MNEGVRRRPRTGNAEEEKGGTGGVERERREGEKHVQRGSKRLTNDHGCVEDDGGCLWIGQVDQSWARTHPSCKSASGAGARRGRRSLPNPQPNPKMIPPSMRRASRLTRVGSSNLRESTGFLSWPFLMTPSMKGAVTRIAPP
eukprot:14663-Hanusia_phi.AAC.4